MGFAWNAITKDFGGVAVPIAVAAFVMTLPAAFIYGTAVVLPSLMVNSEYDAALVTYAVMPVFVLVLLAVQSFVLGGVTHFALGVARGRKPEFGEVFSGGRYFGSMFVGQLLFGLLFSIGFALCVVPGYIVAFGCMFYPHLIVDKGLGAVDALKESWRLTTGHKVNLLVLWLLLMGVYLLSYLACCVGTLLAGLPIVMLSLAYVYLRLTGEHPRLPG